MIIRMSTATQTVTPTATDRYGQNGEKPIIESIAL
jgi:hypothetical protein